MINTNISMSIPFVKGQEEQSQQEDISHYTSQTLTKSELLRDLDPAHYEELKGSGISDELIAANFVSLEEREPYSFLFYSRDLQRTNLGQLAAHWRKNYGHIEYGGWWCNGLDPSNNWEPMQWGCFKPNSPRIDREKGKPIKYETPPKTPTRAFFLDIPSNPRFWLEALANPDIPIIIVEGVKKAACLLGAGYVVIALPGIWNHKKENELIAELQPFATQGRQFYICFDRDINWKTIRAVNGAISSLGALLIKAGCKVKVVELPAGTEKVGPDDFVVANGIEAFEKVLSESKDYHSWLRKLDNQFSKPQSGGSNKPPKPAAIADELAEKYRYKIIWNVEAKSWYQYSTKQEGVWEPASEEEIHRVVRTELNVNPDTLGNYGFDYVSSTTKLLRSDLLVPEWVQRDNVVPLQNGVLNLETKKLMPHSPGNYLLWCLPYDYNPIAACDPIQEWLLEATNNNPDQVQLLRGYLNAIVKGRADLQRYLELIGPGGTGKGTFFRLAQALVGEQNCFTTNLDQLEHNRFETAGIYGKRLVLVSDSERYGGSVSNLKALTGQDRLRNERKGVQQGKGFVFGGMVLLAANEAIQSSDYTSGLERRRLTVPFTKQVRPEERRDLEAEFKPYLPGLLNWVLDMSDQEVTALIRNTHKSVPSLRGAKLESLVSSNPMADWVNLRVFHRPEEQTYIGNNSDPVEKKLYPNYSQYCKATGAHPVSMKRFSDLLLDLCNAQLGWSDVKKDRNPAGNYIKGLLLARPSNGVPFSITGESLPEGHDLLVTDGNGSMLDSTGSVLDSVTGQTLTSAGSAGYAGLNEIQCRKKENKNENPERLSLEAVNVNRVISIEGVGGNNPAYPADPAPEPVSAITHPAHQLSPSSTEFGPLEGSLRNTTPDVDNAFVENDVSLGGGYLETEVLTPNQNLESEVLSSRLKLGDRVHYLGAEPSLAQLCDSRLLTVRAIDGDVAMVKADTRDIQQPIPLGDLSDPR